MSLAVSFPVPPSGCPGRRTHTALPRRLTAGRRARYCDVLWVVGLGSGGTGQPSDWLRPLETCGTCCFLGPPGRQPAVPQPRRLGRPWAQGPVRSRVDLGSNARRLAPSGSRGPALTWKGAPLGVAGAPQEASTLARAGAQSVALLPPFSALRCEGDSLVV